MGRFFLFVLGRVYVKRSSRKTKERWTNEEKGKGRRKVVRGSVNSKGRSRLEAEGGLI